jgi:hypothetical protein
MHWAAIIFVCFVIYLFAAGHWRTAATLILFVLLLLFAFIHDGAANPSRW